jgi:hypothetical protein
MDPRFVVSSFLLFLLNPSLLSLTNKQEGRCLGGPKVASLTHTLSAPFASCTPSERALRVALLTVLIEAPVRIQCACGAAYEWAPTIHS